MSELVEIQRDLQVSLIENHLKMDELQDEMTTIYPEIKLNVKHSFCGGVYAREVFIPKGTWVSSYTHKREHFCVCSSGAIIVGGIGAKARLVMAPETIQSPPGARRWGLALADTVWTSFHYVGDERDLRTLESELYVEAKYLDSKVVGILTDGTTGQEEGYSGL